MKKWLEFLIPVKTAACYSFTAALFIYTVICLFTGRASIPIGIVLSFLLLSLAAAVLQIVAFTSLVFKKLRYGPRLLLFILPFFAVLSLIAKGFHWFPPELGSAWMLFLLLFLLIFVIMTVGFEIYFRVTGHKYDGLLGQYRLAKRKGADCPPPPSQL